MMADKCRRLSRFVCDAENRYVGYANTILGDVLSIQKGCNKTAFDVHSLLP